MESKQRPSQSSGAGVPAPLPATGTGGKTTPNNRDTLKGLGIIALFVVGMIVVIVGIRLVFIALVNGMLANFGVVPVLVILALISIGATVMEWRSKAKNSARK